MRRLNIGNGDRCCLAAYSALAPAVLYLVSMETTWAALLAAAGVLLTLPFWPILAPVLFGVSTSGSSGKDLDIHSL